LLVSSYWSGVGVDGGGGGGGGGRVLKEGFFEVTECVIGVGD